MLDERENWGIDPLEFLSNVNTSFKNHKKVDGRTKKVLFHAWMNGNWNKRYVDNSMFSNNEKKESKYENPPDTATDAFFKADDIRDIKEMNGQGQSKRKDDNWDNKQRNKKVCKTKKFEAIKYSLGPNEEYIASTVQSGRYRHLPCRVCKLWDDWEVDRYGNANLVIMEYLVNISKRRALWSLNKDILKINDSDYQYAVSIKEDTAYTCLHSPKTTKETSSIRRTLLLVAMAAIAEAGIITTTTFEDNPIRKQTGEDCAVQMVKQEMLSHCRMYITSSQGYQSPRAFMNPAEEHMKLCCKQLENMGEMCMCEGIKMMMNMQGWTQQQQMGQMILPPLNLTSSNFSNPNSKKGIMLHLHSLVTSLNQPTPEDNLLLECPFTSQEIKDAVRDYGKKSTHSGWIHL
ncbi:reverse transcriptase domain-containing protein [Tanacetum coccineum]|uniref:Reverse transcriptase domain-containing protein n=1 Tax=Tanacetum coccineum TaxID=301880 RepID=A0ABQ5HDC6_9ASTR